MCDKTEKLLTRTEAITQRKLKSTPLMQSGGHRVRRIKASEELTVANLATQARGRKATP